MACILYFAIGVTTSENVPSIICRQRRFRLARAFALSDKNRHCAFFFFFLIAKDAMFLHMSKDSDQTA